MTTVLVTGANRGLGLEFVRQYLEAGWQVLATCRDTGKAHQLRALGKEHEDLECFELDLGDFQAVDLLADELRGRPIDVLINNAGQFGPKRMADNDLRQSFGHIDYQIVEDILRVNTIAPLKITEALVENIAASEQKKIVTISSIVGSIAGGEAGLYAYRTSKAAVNMIMATLARDLKSRGIIVTSVNPGWVQTDMGGPSADIGVKESISQLRSLIANLSMKDSASFKDYDGSNISW